MNRKARTHTHKEASAAKRADVERVKRGAVASSSSRRSKAFHSASSVPQICLWYYVRRFVQYCNAPIPYTVKSRTSLNRNSRIKRTARGEVVGLMMKFNAVCCSGGGRCLDQRSAAMQWYSYCTGKKTTASLVLSVRRAAKRGGVSKVVYSRTLRTGNCTVRAHVEIHQHGTYVRYRNEFMR